MRRSCARRAHDELVAGAARSNMDELAAEMLAADKLLAF
jgi:hypothetical protein